MSGEVARLMNLAREMFREAESNRASGFPRGAANAAYLAMEHAARAMLLTRSLRVRKHQAVIGEFGRLFAMTRTVDPKFHRYLIDDFDLRKAAEYDPVPEPPVTLERAADVLAGAFEFLAMAQNFLEGTGGSIG
jgi:uncharacterized protein (UPF0332 family)